MGASTRSQYVSIQFRLCTFYCVLCLCEYSEEVSSLFIDKNNFNKSIPRCLCLQISSLK